MSLRKTYCIICKTYKPDWSHHCSTCDVCVLNFDHHCPWINSCIGFWNWKYFILMLIYAILTIIVYLITFLDWYIQNVKDIYNFFYYFSMNIWREWPILELINTFFFMIFQWGILLLFFALLKFTNTHITYICKNDTTIDALVWKNNMN